MKYLLIIILSLNAQIEYEVHWESVKLIEDKIEVLKFGSIANWVSAIDYNTYKITKEKNTHRFSNLELAKAFIEGMTTDERLIFEKKVYHKNIELYKIERIE